MKRHFIWTTVLCSIIATLCVIGMVGCGETEEPEETVSFTQAIPADGSTIQTDAEIIVTFDGTPTGLTANNGRLSLSGVNATIKGPFTAGTLNLVLTWDDGATSLAYTVEGSGPDEPDIPPAPEGMVLIPAGEFEMGSNDAEADNDEQPVRTVYVDAFYMDETEVTNTQFKEFVLENPRWQKGRIEARFDNGEYLHIWHGNNYPNGKSNHPVVNISWRWLMQNGQENVCRQRRSGSTLRVAAWQVRSILTGIQ